MRLSILICSIHERAAMLKELIDIFNKQKPDDVEILVEVDNKRMKIGDKRNLLLSRAKGDYIVFFDDDDMPTDDYIPSILKALESNPDCVGMLIMMTTNGKTPQACCHSLKYPTWQNNKDGFDYVRNVTHFNPVKRSIALQIKFPSINFGEDKVYSDGVSKICTNEVMINKTMFHYRYTNTQTAKQKYGI